MDSDSVPKKSVNILGYSNTRSNKNNGEDPMGVNQRPQPSAPLSENTPNKNKSNRNENPALTNQLRTQPSAPPPAASAPPIDVIASVATAAAAPLVLGGPGLWNFFNALAFLILLSVIFTSIFWGISKLTAVSEIKKNWKLYRCDPSIMPFASFYGYNTEENFNYCMGSIFNIHSADITGSFSSVLGTFTSILSVLMTAVNSIRTSVATLGGGINVIFQDFTDRISTFFFQLRMSAIRIKMLIQRMYATMFAILYMGTSAITGGVSFGNTVLFSFLDTFCFVPETQIHVQGKGIIPIYEVQIGDVLLPSGSRVTSKFHFAANGQPMVKIGKISVSSNHYIQNKQDWIRVEDHPDAIALGPHIGSSLICLNTSDHTIPIDGYVFRDYDETEENDVDQKTMRFIEQRLNSLSEINEYTFYEYMPAVDSSTEIRLHDGSTVSADVIQLGTHLSTGCKVVGKVHREITEYVILPNQDRITPSTLIWNKSIQKWIRAGMMYPVHKNMDKPYIYIALFVTPSSMIELSNGIYIRDSIELCSPDAETYYAQQLKQRKT